MRQFWIFFMSTKKYNDESLVERDEIFYPQSNVIDAEPHYSNFATIQNALLNDNQQKQGNTVSYKLLFIL